MVRMLVSQKRSICHLPTSLEMVAGMDTHPKTVWTVGHSTRTFEDFLQLLQKQGISLVVDVRKMPRSRRNPQFKKETLASALPTAGIGYIEAPGLGGLRRRRPDSPNTAWKNASFQGYADYMLTSDFDRSPTEMLESAANERPALLCAEAVPWRCHRSLIADALVIRGIAVEHILGPGKTRRHTLRPWAHVEGLKITYPQGQILPEPHGISGSGGH